MGLLIFSFKFLRNKTGFMLGQWVLSGSLSTLLINSIACCRVEVTVPLLSVTQKEKPIKGRHKAKQQVIIAGLIREFISVCTVLNNDFV